jgi:uncharacterized membrane protein YcaP (DUF421 family)
MNLTLFDGWESLFRTLIITFLAYLSIIVLLRVSGKRTLSKMNAFDFIVTIALGSALASVATSKDVSLADGLAVFAILIFMQFFLTWLSVRIKSFKKIITSQPSMLLYRGRVIEENIKRERITIEEIKNAIRKKGLSDLSNIDIIILETTGDITIIKNLEDDAVAIEGIKNPFEERDAENNMKVSISDLDK